MMSAPRPLVCYDCIRLYNPAVSCPHAVEDLAAARAEVAAAQIRHLDAPPGSAFIIHLAPGAELPTFEDMLPFHRFLAGALQVSPTELRVFVLRHGESLETVPAEDAVRALEHAAARELAAAREHGRG